MKKFNATSDTTFSVVGYSKPYAFGRLNNEILILLSSLGVSNDKLLAKQQSYLEWISQAGTDPLKAFNFLCAMDNYSTAERVLLDGLSDQNVDNAIKRAQNAEIASFRNDRNKDRSRTIVEKSRRIFGVCDPFRTLREGEVQIRITMARKGPSTPIHGDVLVVRNPCLHPGNIIFSFFAIF
jgi:regulator of nonsense transcripts 1